MAANNEKVWVRPGTISKEIEIRPKQIVEWINQGTVPAGCFQKVGGMWFIHRENFMRWFEAGKLPAEARRRGGNRRG
jgi:hypothetical protein